MYVVTTGGKEYEPEEESWKPQQTQYQFATQNGQNQIHSDLRQQLLARIIRGCNPQVDHVML
jgi:hypothetical protein